jgi:hypothetical protein
MKTASRLAAIAAIMGCFFSLSVAQSSGSCFAKGDQYIQAGIGVGLYGNAYGDLTFPPISGVYEYGIDNLFSIGGGIGFQGSSYSYYDPSYGEWEWSYSYIPIMARVAFHPFNLDAISKSIPSRDKWDVYGGLSLGYAIVNYNETLPPNGFEGAPPYSAGTSYFQAGFLLGTRWYLNPKFAVYFEEGSGFGWVNVGACWKI